MAGAPTAGAALVGAHSLISNADPSVAASHALEAGKIVSMVGMLIADRFERKHVIVAMALVNIVAGLLYRQASGVASVLLLGVPFDTCGQHHLV